MDLGSARNPHVLRVRSGFCVLSASKLAAPITPIGIGSKSENRIKKPTLLRVPQTTMHISCEHSVL
ncbi:hypothetical protein CWD78_03455 [Dickeya dadantii]|nr:hypothetical protein [Dickeya dadantii]